VLPLNILRNQKELISYEITGTSVTSVSVFLPYLSGMQISFLGGTILLSVGRPVLPNLSTLSQKTPRFSEKKFIEHKICGLVFATILS